MPLTTTKGNPIKGWLPASKKQEETAGSLISELDYADIWREKQKTIAAAGGIRIDHQGAHGGKDGHRHHNIQVQTGSCSIAHVDVSESADDSTHQAAVLQAVQTALQSSLSDGHSYFVAGSLP